MGAPFVWRHCVRYGHQQTLAPEVQTTGDTTPAQQIVWAESLTTSGGSNRWGLTELRQSGFGVGLCGVSVTGPVTLLSVFHLSIASRKDFSDFSAALFFPRASAVPG